MTIFLVVVAALVLWVLVAGIEAERADAGLAPVSTQPGVGAVFVIGGTRATGLEVVRLLRARGDEVAVLARPREIGDREIGDREIGDSDLICPTAS